MDSERDNDLGGIWFRAPASITEDEATCGMCERLILPGETIAEDGRGYIHEACYRAERENDENGGEA